jgi:hypothetical protein
LAPFLLTLIGVSDQGILGISYFRS